MGVANEPKPLGLPKVGAPPKLGCAPKAGGLPNVGAPPKTGRGKAPVCCCCVGEPKPVLAIEEPPCENELNGELAVAPKPLTGELNIFDCCCCCCASVATAPPPNIEPPDAAVLFGAAPKAEPTKLKPDGVGVESGLLAAAAAEAKMLPVDWPKIEPLLTAALAGVGEPKTLTASGFLEGAPPNIEPPVQSALLTTALPNIDAVFSAGFAAALPKIDPAVLSGLLTALLPNMEPAEVLPTAADGLVGIVAAAAAANMPPVAAPNPTLLELPKILPPLAAGA